MNHTHHDMAGITRKYSYTRVIFKLRRKTPTNVDNVNPAAMANGYDLFITRPQPKWTRVNASYAALVRKYS